MNGHPKENRPPLDPDREAMRQFGYAMIDSVVDHLSTLSDQRVVRRGTGADFAALVDEPLPVTGNGIAESLEFFFESVVPEMTRANHPRFHAYIPAPSSFAGALGEMLAAGTNPFVGSWLGGATVSALEVTVLRWICELLDYPIDSGGIFTSGGSMANLIALASARTAHDHRLMSDGRIYVSCEGHASMTKAAQVLGFSGETIRTIGVDSSFRMDVQELSDAIASDQANGKRPFFVAANAGTTNTGAIDPLNRIAELCRESNLWFHVDGAYGGFAFVSTHGRSLFRGMNQADSLTLDPHKWLYCPMGTGCVLVRDREMLERAFSTEGDYLQDIPIDEVNFYNRGPELSRPARVLSVWMVLRSHGADTLARHVDHDIRLANLAADLLSQGDLFEVIPPQLSVVAFRFRMRDGESESLRSARDMALLESILVSGKLMLSSTRLGNVTTLRLVVMNHRTTESEVRRSVATIMELAARISIN